MAAVAAANPFARHVALGQSAGAEATLRLRRGPHTPISIVGHTNFSAERSAAAPPTCAWRRTPRRARSRVDVERVPLDEVADAWRRQGESPNRKLVIVP